MSSPDLQPIEMILKLDSLLPYLCVSFWPHAQHKCNTEKSVLFLTLYFSGKYWIWQIPGEPQPTHPVSQTPAVQDLSFLPHLTIESHVHSVTYACLIVTIKIKIKIVIIIKCIYHANRLYYI